MKSGNLIRFFISQFATCSLEYIVVFFRVTGAEIYSTSLFISTLFFSVNSALFSFLLSLCKRAARGEIVAHYNWCCFRVHF